MPTVAKLIEAVCEQFEAGGLTFGHGTDNPWDEAVALVVSVTGCADDRSSLQTQVSAEHVSRCLDLAALRVTDRQPLAYLLGTCHYMGLQFNVRPGVVVPRSPIGYLLQDGLSAWLPDRVGRVLDLCTGSGCLGILAAHIFPDAHVTLVDIDPAAIQLAEENIAQYELAQRVDIVRADVTGPLALPESFDLVLCNPPYVDAADMQSLPAEFAAEPVHGLAAGEQGLDVIEAVLAQLGTLLSSDGLFIGEVGASARHLIRRHPVLPLIWPDLPLGGEGVFVLEATALTSHTAPRS